MTCSEEAEEEEEEDALTHRTPPPPIVFPGHGEEAGPCESCDPAEHVHLQGSVT